MKLGELWLIYIHSKSRFSPCFLRYPLQFSWFLVSCSVQGASRWLDINGHVFVCLFVLFRMFRMFLFIVFLCFCLVFLFRMFRMFRMFKISDQSDQCYPTTSKNGCNQQATYPTTAPSNPPSLTQSASICHK